MIGAFRNYGLEAENNVKAVFADDAVLDEALGWARTLLAEARIDPRRRPGRAAKRLRTARPELTMLGARYIVHRLRGGARPPKERRVHPALH